MSQGVFSKVSVKKDVSQGGCRMTQEFNIVLLEDDPSVREILSRVLGQVGRVLPATNSDDLFAYIRDGEKIDLFVLDNRIKTERRYRGECAGLRVLDTLRDTYGTSAPVIVITGYLMSVDDQELLSRQNAHFLRNACIPLGCYPEELTWGGYT